MNDHYQLSTHRLYQKFQKVCRQLARLMQAGKAISSERIASLRKRRSRFAKQLLSSGTALLKTGGAAAFSLLLATQVHAQNCNKFVKADSANPVRRAGLPQNLWQPTFVDIDGDGDLDCYESSPNRDNGGSANVKITFLRNTGTKKFPYYVVDSVSGFPASLSAAAPYNSDVDRTRFVDIDGDGDYDCFVGNYDFDNSRMLFYKNVGTASAPEFVNTPSENPLSGFGGSYGLQVSFADLDGDGDYDLITTDIYYTKIYKNTGTETKAVFTKVQNSLLTFYSRIVLYDYNKDSLTDAFIGGDFYKNVGTKTKPAFKRDFKDGPVLPSGFALYTFADLNNDGFAETFSVDGKYATTAPVATVARLMDGDPDYITLQAHPDSSAYTYRWWKDGKLIPGATNSIYQAATSGSYSVEITGSCGTGISLPYVVTLVTRQSDRSSVQFTKAATSLTAYPNPFTSQFTLNLGKNYSPNTVVKISDIQGRIISTTKANSNVMQLGSNLQKGVYIVQVIQNNTVVLTQKMIKE